MKFEFLVLQLSLYPRPRHGDERGEQDSDQSN